MRLDAEGLLSKPLMMQNPLGVPNSRILYFSTGGKKWKHSELETRAGSEQICGFEWSLPSGLWTEAGEGSAGVRKQGTRLFGEEHYVLLGRRENGRDKLTKY